MLDFSRNLQLVLHHQHSSEKPVAAAEALAASLAGRFGDVAGAIAIHELLELSGILRGGHVYPGHRNEGDVAAAIADFEQGAEQRCAWLGAEETLRPVQESLRRILDMQAGSASSGDTVAVAGRTSAYILCGSRDSAESAKSRAFASRASI